ncbi:hypothetical protein AKJ57_01285 [candidate division MSBL1 archaeon SCGC-AAA259A05]|uniref:DUF4258 domain-containing protein n=1 Tax=candidate division MSBL1 archaeon SCGC-AAA259A05 TaxID=1698259 RepID=A0A133UB65_9EURY|nr:hypothetical protein AKJ57_01285 [candidate division MSBL1 archaeon SCGC-AAA259A05]
MLKFLVDECTGAKVSDALSDDEFSVKYVGRVMPGAKDKLFRVVYIKVVEGRYKIVTAYKTSPERYGERV